MVFSVDLLALALLSYVVSGLSLQPSALAWYCVIISLLIFGAQSVGYISSSFSSNPVVGLALRKCLYESTSQPCRASTHRLLACRPDTCAEPVLLCG